MQTRSQTVGLSVCRDLGCESITGTVGSNAAGSWREIREMQNWGTESLPPPCSFSCQGGGLR